MSNCQTEPLELPKCEQNINESLQKAQTKPVAKGYKTIGKYCFSLDRRIGRGLTGDVYVGLNEESKQLVCVKVIDHLEFRKEEQKDLLRNEIELQQLALCEHIVNIYEVFQQNSFTFIVGEFCEMGDLYKMLKMQKKPFSEAEVKKIAVSLIKALAKLKQKRIIHRDIKPQNILLRQGQVKLGDFGFAILEKDLQGSKKLSIGSPIYMSLEALENREYSHSSDIFSLGVVLYELLEEQCPWECSDEAELIRKMKNEPVIFRNEASEQLAELIKNCLRHKVEQRSTIQELLMNQFLFPTVD